MRYVVYGAGAVGGVIGGTCTWPACPTTLVARGEHLDAIRRDGLTLDTAEAVAPPRHPRRTDAAEVDWTDDTVVLLAVKSHQAADALDDLAAHAPAGTVVVCAQNGVANEAAALRRFARDLRRLRDAARDPPRARRGRGEVPPDARDPRRRPGARRAPTARPRPSPPTCARRASSPSRGPTSWRGSTASC